MIMNTAAAGSNIQEVPNQVYENRFEDDV